MLLTCGYMKRHCDVMGVCIMKTVIKNSISVLSVLEPTVLMTSLVPRNLKIIVMAFYVEVSRTNCVGDLLGPKEPKRYCIGFL